MTRELAPQWASALGTFGFVVLRQFFDPAALAAEVDRVMADGILRDVPDRRDIRFQYVPMMTAQTPVSLGLLDCAETVAGHVVATEPGDMILLDERVLHTSVGGGIRRQWRVDYPLAEARKQLGYHQLQTRRK